MLLWINTICQGVLDQAGACSGSACPGQLLLGQGCRRYGQWEIRAVSPGDKDFEIHIQESASSLPLDLNVWEYRTVLWSPPCLSPVLGGCWEPHISVQRRGDPPAASRLRSSCPAKVGRNCLAKQKMLICPNCSAGTQSFHHQEKLFGSGLEILAEAGGRAGSPCGMASLVGDTLPPSPAYP